MYSALRPDGKLVLADKDLDPLQEFRCPTCHSRVSLHVGFYRRPRPHFAHFPGRSLCPKKGGGESFEHAALKVDVYNLLSREIERGNLHTLKVEAPFGQVIADLGFKTATGKEGAIELVCRNLSLRHTHKKVEEYRQSGVHMLWLFSTSVLKSESGQPLAPEAVRSVMQGDGLTWTELDGWYRVPSVLVYLYRLLHRAFFVLPSGLLVPIRLVRGSPAKKTLLWKVQLLPERFYPLKLSLLTVHHKEQSFPEPLAMPVVSLMPSKFLGEVGSLYRRSDHSDDPKERKYQVSERTRIQINFPSEKND